jgi:hypothetical protein
MEGGAKFEYQKGPRRIVKIRTIACAKALNPKLEFFLKHHRAEIINLLRNRQPHVY